MSSAQQQDTLAVYSDYVCPFWDLGRAAMREYLGSGEDPQAVEWRLYDLRGYKRGPDGEIDHDVDDGKDDDYFAQVRENVERLRTLASRTSASAPTKRRCSSTRATSRR